MPLFQHPSGQIHYQRSGEGDHALVFVHGALCDHADWQPQMAHFGGQVPTLALDLHGHGQSSQSPGHIGVTHFAGDLVSLCAALGLRRVVLVGHSMGCRVLLQAWRDAPQLVAGLVFIDGAYLTPGLLGVKSHAEREAMAQAARDRGAALYEAQGPSARARRGFSQMFFDPRFDAQRDRMIARAMALPDHVARELMPDFAAWDVLHLEEALARVTVPVLALACTYMNAAHERVSLGEGMDTPWLQALRLHVPSAQVIRYQGSGHFPMIEQPQRVNREIEEFLRREALLPFTSGR